VRSFDAQIAVSSNGSVIVVEDITVDFRNLPSHGIFREIPTRYNYDNDHDRVIKLSNVSVDNGVSAVPFESSSEGGYRRLKIGDPDVEVTGVQHYRITYTVEGALNAFDTHDELYWNVTGNRWDVLEAPLPSVPGRGITQLHATGPSARRDVQLGGPGRPPLLRRPASRRHRRRPALRGRLVSPLHACRATRHGRSRWHFETSRSQSPPVWHFALAPPARGG
jgi:hypothetical protein